MKIYINNVKESWIIDRLTKEWFEENSDITTKYINRSDLIWISANWVWKKIPKKHLKSKKVICSVYHIDFEKFDEKSRKDFYELDQYVDEYHTISEISKLQIQKLTDKKITSIPFWINQKNWFNIEDKEFLRDKYQISINDYIVGSFQRDTEGFDLKSPKLIKGPDIFYSLVKEIYSKNKNLKVLLTGTRRQYLLEKFKEDEIPYLYYEMVDIQSLNELYNLLDLYIVTSRIEGGPQAILVAGLNKTPIVSTHVWVAPEILNEKSFFNPSEFDKAEPDINYAFNKSKQYIIPAGMEKFRKMFTDLYEN